MYTLRAPAPALAPFVEHYWFVDARARPVELQVDVYVDARTDLVFNFGAPWTRERPGAPPTAHPGSVVDCQRRHPLRVRQSGAVMLVGLRFHLGGLGAFSAAPLRPFTDQTPHPAELFGPSAVPLEARLRASPDPDAQAAQLDAWLLGQLRRDDGRQTFEAALARLISAQPAPAVSALAAEVGVSARALERLFDRHLGLPPRTVGRVARFQRALRALMRDPGGPLADVAHAAGYFDQAHLVREFKEMTGGVPRGYRGFFPPAGPHDFAPNVVAFMQDGPPRRG